MYIKRIWHNPERKCRFWNKNINREICSTNSDALLTLRYTTENLQNNSVHLCLHFATDSHNQNRKPI